MKKSDLAILCDLFGMVKRPFLRLSDLQPRDKKVTLNHLDLAHLFQYQEVASTSSQNIPECQSDLQYSAGFGEMSSPCQGFPLSRGESKHRLATPGPNKAATRQLVFFSTL